MNNLQFLLELVALLNKLFCMFPMLYASHLSANSNTNRLSTTSTQSLIHHTIFSQTGPPRLVDLLSVTAVS